ncbi:MAG: M81 family metallopeptidase [Actinobacteria bacterium]|nr:M81 family metallopeptidase [Actinomycetota bacterium]
MRVAIAGFQHESNSFASTPATLDKWKEAGILYGDDIRREYEDSRATIAGILGRLRDEKDIEIVPLVFSRLTPMGPLTVEATEFLMSEILRLIEEEGPWDAVFLAQHGAAVSDKYLDADGEIAEQTRQLVGPDVLIVTNLDMHANISKKVVANSDIVKVYQTNPHLDTYERAYESADLLLKCLRKEIVPTSFIATPPLVANILKQGTSDPVMTDLLTMAAQEAKRPGVLSVSVVEGYPYSDVPQMGMTFLAITNNDPALAQEVAENISRYAWSLREELNGVATSTEVALVEASNSMEFPVVLFDVGDNVYAGTTGDSTFVLQASRKLGITGLMQAIYDPTIVAEISPLGIGAHVDVMVGGKMDDMHGEPFHIKGVITSITDGKYAETKPSHGGFLNYDDGLSLAIATDDGNNFLLTSLPAGSNSLLQFRSAGLEPLDQKIIVVKGVHSPRPAYESIAKKIYWLSTGGASTADLSNFNYKHRRIPLYPFELTTEWS